MTFRSARINAILAASPEAVTYEQLDALTTNDAVGEAEQLADHLDLWRDVLGRVEEPYAAAPACLTAYSARLSGDGALANVALDRAVQAEPDYAMAAMLRDMMRAGVSSSKAHLRMTPEELAAAYEQQTGDAAKSCLYRW